MRRNQTYPKENEKKLKETIKDLRSELRQLQKANKILREEIELIMTPVRTRKKHIDRNKLPEDLWREDFVKRFKDSLKERQEAEKCDLKIKSIKS